MLRRRGHCGILPLQLQNSRMRIENVPAKDGIMFIIFFWKEMNRRKLRYTRQQEIVMPLISVVMPTYNASDAFLKEAVESILNQSFRDFEFIIIDDGSTNDTPAYLNSLTDPRIQILRNERNIGITRSLNIGFRAAQGKYIARMDSDDVSMPDRLEKQFAFMESHPDVTVCGSMLSRYKGDAVPDRKKTEDMESYRIRMLFLNPGPSHPTAFFRREVLVQHHIEYDESLKYSQDYGMWMTVSQFGRICILPDRLLFRRYENNVSTLHRAEQIQCDKMTQKKLLRRLLGSVTEEELDIHYRYSTGYYDNLVLSDQVIKWYTGLIEANRRKCIYNQKAFSEYVYRILLYIIKGQPETSYAAKAVMSFRLIPWYIVLKELFAFCRRKARRYLYGKRKKRRVQ